MLAHLFPGASMRTRFSFPSLLLILAFGCDAPVTPANDAAVYDGGSDAGMVDDVGIDGGGTGCGTAAPDLSATGSTEGLSIGRDGTIYYSVSGGVARITPDGTLEANWLRITGAGTVWGMVLDETNTHLYVGSPSLGEVVTVSGLDGTPTYETLIAIEAPNGLTFGPDGFLYVSDFAGNDVRRVDVTAGTDESILASPIASANGLAFTDAGTLLVDSYSGARVFELTLDATFHETGRTTAANGVGAPDGIAVDENGVLYVGDNNGRVLRMAADGTVDTVLVTGLSRVANLEWGAGPLDCHHLYVASGAGVSRIEDLTVGQRDVPWH
jgi:sugar lactone lactonase YvrE